MYEHILYAVEGPTAIITLNRPDRLNAWTSRMGLEVRHALATAEADQEIVGIVITGAGRAFCAGADMGTLQEIFSAGAKKEETDPVLEAANPGDPDMGEGFRQQLSYLMSVRKPIIAAVNGPCVGMAAVLSLNCDMRFVAEKAFFMMAFSQRGLVAEWGSCWMLPRTWVSIRRSIFF
jgi:enoyl-CoA hydratase/carnithine racemase